MIHALICMLMILEYHQSETFDNYIIIIIISHLTCQQYCDLLQSKKCSSLVQVMAQLLICTILYCTVLYCTVDVYDLLCVQAAAPQKRSDGPPRVL